MKGDKVAIVSKAGTKYIRKKSEPRELANLVAVFLNHPNVLTLRDLEIRRGAHNLLDVHYYFASQEVDLAKVLRGPVVSIQTRRKWMHCLAGALHHMLLQAVSHQDIKEENVFVSGSNLVVGDFDGVVFLGEKRDLYTPFASRPMKEQMHFSNLFNFATPADDLFSYGRLCLLMALGQRSGVWEFPEREPIPKDWEFCTARNLPVYLRSGRSDSPPKKVRRANPSASHSATIPVARSMSGHLSCANTFSPAGWKQGNTNLYMMSGK